MLLIVICKFPVPVAEKYVQSNCYFFATKRMPEAWNAAKKVSSNFIFGRGVKGITFKVWKKCCSFLCRF